MAEIQPWGITNYTECNDYHMPNVHSSGFCNSTFDGYMCWPMTPENTTTTLPCCILRLKGIKGIIDTNSASRRCSEDGLWLDFEGNEDLGVGWTNFSQCFDPQVWLKLAEKDNKTDAENAYSENILQAARLLEMVGYSISFASILVSIIIISAFRSLKQSKEKRIHRQLYIAMLIQIVIRLVVYIDQYITRTSSSKEGAAVTTISSPQCAKAAGGGNSSFIGDYDGSSGDTSIFRGIDNTPYLCESVYVLLEYARTVMFHWFFIEGLHLHNVLTINVFPSTGGRRLYYVIGWCVPVVMTTAWAIVTANFLDSECWTGYAWTNYYWILEGPRMAIIATNTLFLLNILRVLLTKLRNSNSSETVKVRKALKAAIVLQPLLGTTNVLMVLAPRDTSGSFFAVWTFVYYFLVSFQGFFAALFYCFLNGEVRMVLRKYFEDRQNVRSIHRAAEASSYSHEFGPGSVPRRFSRQGSLPAIFHNTTRRMSHNWSNGSVHNPLGRKTRFRSDAQNSLSGVAELLSNHKKGHLNQLSPIVSMETVAAVGMGGATSTELVGSDDKSLSGDDSPMLLPAITKKMIVFDEEDELGALDSELDSRDDLDKVSENRSPNVPRANIDKNYSVTMNKEDHIFDKTISSPLIEEKEEESLRKTKSLTKNTVRFVGNGHNDTNSMYTKHSSPQCQRQTSLINGGKLQQSLSDNGISQTLIERRSLLSLPNKTNKNLSNQELGTSQIQSKSTSGILTNGKTDKSNTENTSTKEIPVNGH